MIKLHFMLEKIYPGDHEINAKPYRYYPSPSFDI